MANPYLELSYFQVGLAGFLVLFNAVLSLLLKLRLTRSILTASTRTVAQLLLVGIILNWVFEAKPWYIVLLLLTVMTLVAGYTASDRAVKKYRGVFLNSIVSIWASSWIVLAYAVFAVVQTDPWYHPQYVIPLLGMILGNSLNGVSLALDRFTCDLALKRNEVETLLALGANRWEAAHPFFLTAVRTGMIPMINSMMVAGLVSLPGMMTGQILSGISPFEAVKYQIVIMLFIATSTLIGTSFVSFLGYSRLFSKNHQFLFERIGS